MSTLSTTEDNPESGNKKRRRDLWCSDFTWKSVKHIATDRDTTIEGAIIYLLEIRRQYEKVRSNLSYTPAQNQKEENQQQFDNISI